MRIFMEKQKPEFWNYCS